MTAQETVKIVRTIARALRIRIYPFYAPILMPDEIRVCATTAGDDAQHLRELCALAQALRADGRVTACTLTTYADGMPYLSLPVHG